MHPFPPIRSLLINIINGLQFGNPFVAPNCNYSKVFHLHPYQPMLMVVGCVCGSSDGMDTFGIVTVFVRGLQRRNSATLVWAAMFGCFILMTTRAAGCIMNSCSKAAINLSKDS